MTQIYFIRHATPDRTKGEDATYPLSEKGQADVALVTAFLKDKAIDAVLSSPFKRSYDTVADFAKTAGLTVEVIDDFRERAIGHEWVKKEDFRAYTARQWDDVTYKLPGGESFSEVQARNIAALEAALTRYKGKNIAIGTHGTALSTIIRYYDSSYSFDEKHAMPMPWVAKLTFNNHDFISIEKIDLFQAEEK